MRVQNETGTETVEIEVYGEMYQISDEINVKYAEKM